MLRNKKGFTLLELIIVVIIIGILASIALPRYIRIAEKGRLSEGKSLLGVIKGAQLRYSAQYSTFTDDVSLLDVTIQTPKYFDMIAVNGGPIDVETTIVAQATRNMNENPSGLPYVVTIDQAGTMYPDPTAQQYW